MSRALSERGRAQHGFTLIEVLVSALLVLIISAGVATALVSATDFTGHERNTSQANAVADQDQERLKSMTDSQLTSLHQTRTVSLNSTQFTVVSTAEFLDANGTSSCTSKSEAYFKLTSTVTSAATAGNPGQSVTAEAIITRPLAGSLVVPVQDQTSAALQGATVSISGQNTGYNSSATTDQNGCVAFAGLPTDSYTITATDTGYVDPDGNASPSETATVNQTNVTSAGTMILGSAGAVKVGFVTQGTGVTYDQLASPFASGHGAAPAGYEISYYGSGNGSNMSNNDCLLYPGTACTGTGTSPVTYTVHASQASSSLTPGNLFPFYMGSTSRYANNYQVWAGSCEQEQPLQPPTVAGTSGVYQTDFATVAPGQGATPAVNPTVDATVFEPAIDVAVQYNGGTAVAPSHVSIAFSGYNSAGTSVTCVDNWNQVAPVGSETVGGVTYAIYPAPFASQDAKGSATASNTGDPGTIKVCVDYNSRYEWSPALTTTNFTGPNMVPVMDVKKNGLSGTCPT
ncbi:MAG: carboxypeptidase regulatory-like domain-containing protein [Solirubrobacteraceae bacterium]